MTTATSQPMSIPAGVFDVAPGITGIQLFLVNAYYIASGTGWVLVDAGLPGTAGRISRRADELFGTPPDAIVLTHGHFDHIGAVRDLAERWDVSIYAHPLEAPYLTGESSYPPPDPSVGGGLMSLMAPLYPRGPIKLGGRFRPLPESGAVPGLPEWAWIHTPGHTPGHISLFRQHDRALIAGDAFITTKQESALAVLSQARAVHGPPMYYTSDWDAARDSVRRLADLGPEIAATGHGLPMSGRELREGLECLADDFDQIARPRRGRYVTHPALADEHGVTYIPAPVPSPVPKYMAATAVGAAILSIAAASRSRHLRRFADSAGRNPASRDRNGADNSGAFR